MQFAWTLCTCENCSCSLHGQFPHGEIAHAVCMDNFRAGKRLMQTAWTISAQGNGSCNLHGQFPHGEMAHATCMDNFLTGKWLMQFAWTISAQGNGSCKLHEQFLHELFVKNAKIFRRKPCSGNKLVGFLSKRPYCFCFRK
jgi:hypothetical protein